MLVPIKAFTEAKVRLAGILDAAERETLARTMAEGVLRAAAPLPLWVVCDDQVVARWAAERGAAVVWTPAHGLNAAVREGVNRLAAAGMRTVIVAHADLPLASDLTSVAETDTIVLAPDRRRDGTNVASVPASCGFVFSYGAGSFARHCQEALRLGVPLKVLERADLAWDVDVPDDLGAVSPGPPATR